MSKTIIKALIYDQTIQLVNLPLIASGSEGAISIECDFDELWEGYGKTAVFYRDKGEVYHVLLVGDAVTVPTEVLTEEGFFYFGIFGTADNTRTTEVLRVTVKQGAITTATAEPAAPTPNIYKQIVANYGKLDGRVSEMAAMRGSGVTEQAISGDCFRGTLYSNGAAAFISIEFYDLPLTAGNSRADLCIPAAFAPLGLVTLSPLPGGQNATVTISPRSWTGTEWAQIEITAGETITEAVEFEGYYHLESVYIPEVADIRVDYLGLQHATAGDAVRAQAQQGQLASTATAWLTTISLPASKWKTEAESLHSQVVTIPGINPYYKVDLLPSAEQLAIFHNKDVAFVTENDDGVVTVYAIGDKPLLDYTMQAQITEVDTW